MDAAQVTTKPTNGTTRRKLPMMAKTDVKPEYFRPAGAARYIGVAPRTIRAWQADGKLPFSRISARCVLIAKTDLDAMIAANRGG
jgi:excisionase family DNA binding protein